jgi:hypothetical protein
VRQERSSWGSKLWGLLFIELTVLVLLVPTHWLDAARKVEIQRIEQRLGVNMCQQAVQKAQGWFQASLVDSGFYQALHHLLIPTEQERQHSKGLEDFGQELFTWLSVRLEALMRMCYQFYPRLALFSLWWPDLLWVGLPAIWEGFMVRRIKWTNFDYIIPVLHHYSLRGIMLLGAWVLMAWLAPIVLEPMLMPAVMMISCLLGGIALGNIPKRI